MDSYLLVVVIAAALVAVLLIPTTFVGVGQRRLNILRGLRIAVIVLLTLAMLRPTAIRSDSQQQTAVLVVLMDFSNSMDLPNAAHSQIKAHLAATAFLQFASNAFSAANLDLPYSLIGVAISFSE